MATLQSGFTCQDFFPYCLDPGSFFTKPVYEPFSALIVRANEWLHANRKWKVKTCESVAFKYKGKDTDFNVLSYKEYGERRTMYIRGLRLWLTELEMERDREQQIRYLDLIPQEVEKAGFFKCAVYETLDTVIAKFNSRIQFNPLPGKVITVETIKMKIDWSSELDPHRSCWDVRGDASKRFMFVIRIFYEITKDKPEEIGLKDFVPDMLQSGGLLSQPKLSKHFLCLVDKVSNWCAQHKDIRICNVQTVEIKRSGKEIDTQKMEYTQHGSARTYYVRILRVAYAKSSLHLNTDALLAGRLVCMTFVPENIKKNFFTYKYEDLTAMKEKVSTWIKATGAYVVNAETIALRMYAGDKAKVEAEVTDTVNKPSRNKHGVFFIRFYVYVV